jgi:hypothetical protein
MAVHYATGVEYRCNLIYADARETADSLSGPGDSCQVPIILAGVAYECFLNELAYTFANPFPGSSLADEAARAASELASLEEKRRSPLDKTRAVYKALRGESLSKGDGPYPDLRVLFRLRDALVHSKAATFDMGRARNGRNFDLVAAMESRKLIPTGSEANPFVWTRHVLTPAVAKWAFDISLDRAAWLVQQFPAPSGERDLMLDLLTRFPLFDS